MTRGRLYHYKRSDERLCIRIYTPAHERQHVCACLRGDVWCCCLPCTLTPLFGSLLVRFTLFQFNPCYSYIFISVSTMIVLMTRVMCSLSCKHNVRTVFRVCYRWCFTILFVISSSSNHCLAIFKKLPPALNATIVSFRVFH